MSSDSGPRRSLPLSTRRVSGLMIINRATMNHRSRRDPQTALKMRLRELAATGSASATGA